MIEKILADPEPGRALDALSDDERNVALAELQNRSHFQSLGHDQQTQLLWNEHRDILRRLDELEADSDVLKHEASNEIEHSLDTEESNEDKTPATGENE